MLKFTLSLISILATITMINCSSVPCGGRGNVVDNTPLPTEWENLNTIPSGGTLCKPEELQMAKYERIVEYADLTPHDTIKKFQKHLTVQGWKQLKYELTDPTFYILTMEQNGHIISVKVSKKVDKGWASVNLKI